MYIHAYTCFACLYYNKCICCNLASKKVNIFGIIHYLLFHALVFLPYIIQKKKPVQLAQFCQVFYYPKNFNLDQLVKRDFRGVWFQFVVWVNLLCDILICMHCKCCVLLGQEQMDVQQVCILDWWFLILILEYVQLWLGLIILQKEQQYLQTLFDIKDVYLLSCPECSIRIKKNAHVRKSFANIPIQRHLNKTQQHSL
eukprot:TRINITY_DN22_c3_g1_i1.p2 TRINITY_DN22_c3_g1~~TRINITY_DN22_c3_g1_i1.p2  ORF type:complete len:198 (+),score=-12.35 TRINITY_DN22_c3_g1_i1:421-1014(+)